jgi:hypothetical protein
MSQFEEYRNYREHGKADGDQQQGGMVEARSLSEQVYDVKRYGDPTERIATESDRTVTRFQRDMQQYRRQQTKDRKTLPVR